MNYEKIFRSFLGEGLTELVFVESYRRGYVTHDELYEETNGASEDISNYEEVAWSKINAGIKDLVQYLTDKLHKEFEEQKVFSAKEEDEEGGEE